MKFKLSSILLSTAIVGLALQNVECSGREAALVNRSIEFIKKKLSTLENEIKNSVATLQEKMHSIIQPSIDEIDTTIDLALNEIVHFKDTCKNDAKDKLGAVKDGFIMDLLNCKRNQVMVTDIEKIVYSAKNLMDSLVINTETLVRGFESCLSFNPFKIGFCLTEQTIRTGVLLMEDTVMTVEFTVGVAEDTGNLGETAVWCIENAKSNLNNNVVQTISAAKMCQNQS